MKLKLCFVLLNLIIFPKEGETTLNLALNRTTDMSSISFHPFPHTSDRAVDGNNDTDVLNGHCIHTREQQPTVWWRVQLNTQSTIQRINIVYRAGFSSRLAGYSVFVTDGIIRSDQFFQGQNQPLFRDTGPNLPSTVQNLQFSPPVTGQVVSIYNNRSVFPLPAGYSQDALLELCEVEVFGCPNGFYGTGACNSRCPVNCQDGVCDPDTGACIRGCISGYTGSRCSQACIPGTFGPNCRGICYCRTGTCNRQTGICNTPGCIAGWFGSNCSLPCNTGTFGEDCMTTCNCRSGECDRFTGLCSAPGCIAGFRGNSCSSACAPGTYGTDCTEICGGCAGGVACDSINGTCYGSCADGYLGDDCRLICSPGFYGFNCTMACGNCYRNRPCHHGTGRCTAQSGPVCQAGYRGGLCTSPCSSNTYGPDCARECGLCASFPCDLTNGTCPGGCSSPDAIGPNCASPLIQGQSSAVTAVLIVLSILLVIALVIVIIILWKRYTFTGMKDQATKICRQVQSSFKSVRDRRPTLTSIRSTKSTKASVTKQQSDADRGKEDVTININDRIPIVCEAGTEETEEEVKEVEDKAPVYTNSVNYTNVVLGDIAVEQLPRIILQKSENENEEFDEEYKSIPYGQHGKCVAAKKSENIKKNRFKAIYPYDHSRVVLKGQSSDYINASFIDGIGKTNAYIASQGPKPDTVDDFWTMIWQENVTTIVMLTNLRESGKRKCHQYWPNEDDSNDSKDLQITCTKEKKYSDFTIRYFTVSDEIEDEERQITQYHYTSWPDHGVPEALGLQQFHQVVIKSSKSEGPLLVHCSAGIGRTGTYIGLDVLLRQGKDTGFINVNNYVALMREKRMNMVQTLDQYIFLHTVLREGFRHVDESIRKSEFLTRYQTMTEAQQPTNMSTLRKQFQDLESCRPQYGEKDYKGAMLPANKSKNRTSEALPVEQFRPQLTSKTEGHNDYINAVQISTYTEGEAMFVTRSPLPNTVVDCWRLITDYEIDTVIIQGSTDNEDFCAWIPSIDESKSCGSFDISRSNEEKQKDGLKTSILNILSEETSLKVKLIEMLPWDSASPVPPSPACALRAVQLTRQWRHTNGTGPILFVSPDGVKGCGIFSVIYNSVEQILEDDEVDIYNIVKRVRSRRPELIQTYEEYQSCFHIIKEYLMMDRRYMDMDEQVRYENVRLSTDGIFHLEAHV